MRIVVTVVESERQIVAQVEEHDGDSYLAIEYGTAQQLQKDMQKSKLRGMAQWFKEVAAEGGGDSLYGYLSGMEVREDSRRSGLGGRMLEDALAVAKDLDLRAVWLLPVPEEGQFAALWRFYEKHGFRKQAEVVGIPLLVRVL